MRVRVLTEAQQFSGEVQVGITEKIVNLKDYLPISVAGSLSVLHKSTVIKGDETFAKRNILAGE